MKAVGILCLAALALGPAALSQGQSGAPERTPLLLIQEIPLPHVEGRIDHFTFDAKRKVSAMVRAEGALQLGSAVGSIPLLGSDRCGPNCPPTSPSSN